MKVRSLLKHFVEMECRGPKDVEITGISASSKNIAPGNLFIAAKGLTVDGAQYIEEAIASGAGSIVTDLYNPFLHPKVAQLIVKNVAGIQARLADVFYGSPSQSLWMVGVTGTSGKTTVTYMIRHVLEALLGQTGLIGTVEWVVGRQIFPSHMTTPDVVTCHKLLADMRSSHCKACAMEVSSHALAQGRVEKIDYDVALFTNLSQDHLDYHKDMEDYALAKGRLFSLLNKKHSLAIVNGDDPYSELMKKHTLSPVMTYGLEKECDLMAHDIHFTEHGTSFRLSYKGHVVPFDTPLIGRFNVYNLLAATAVGIARGFSPSDVVDALRTFSHVPGRLERVVNSRGLNIFVDYSHKPDALSNVLRTLSAIKKGRLLCLFGCGGDRDKSKRPLMGEVAQKYADEIIITNDNPRSEDPIAIIQHILSGIKNKGSILVEPDRKKAIEKAIQRMKKEDILLIAGKGHETYQIFANRQIDFDDRAVAQSFCS